MQQPDGGRVALVLHHPWQYVSAQCPVSTVLCRWCHIDIEDIPDKCAVSSRVALAVPEDRPATVPAQAAEHRNWKWKARLLLFAWHFAVQLARLCSSATVPPLHSPTGFLTLSQPSPKTIAASVSQAVYPS